ncbi:MAG: hypothetical protein ACRCZ0_00660 [Cetobacterium sp.]
MHFITLHHTLGQLSPEETLNDAAWLYAQFSLTFDPAEISSEPVNDASQSLLPLYEYFKNNGEVFDKYKRVVNFFEIPNMKKIIPSFNDAKFTERIHFYQNEIVTQDQTPLTFNAFFPLFERIVVVLGKEKIVTNLTPDSPFCQFRSFNTERIIKALHNFKIRSFDHNNKKNKLNWKEYSIVKFSKKFEEDLKGSKEPKPESFSIHHMIPSKTIVDKNQRYFELLVKKSDQMLQHKQFDWIKIQEIQTQKVLLIDAEKLWKKYKDDELEPVYAYERNLNSGQEGFVRTWYRWPLGLLFYGPEGKIRKDDPSDDKNKENPKNKNALYKNQPNDFELRVIHIVGRKYYNKVFKLNNDILKFINFYNQKIKSVEELNKMAIELYSRLRTIHKEAPWVNKIIAPYEVEKWLVVKPDSDCPNKIWEIDTTKEWGVKILAQQADNEQQFNLIEQSLRNQQVSLLAVALLTNAISQTYKHDEFKRKKRLHLTDERLFYVQKLKMQCPSEPTTTQEPENGFWCSPFYLRLNPSYLDIIIYISFKKMFHMNFISE